MAFGIVFNAVVITSLLGAVPLIFFKKEANLSLMRFFRDLSRYKARKRLYGNEVSLVAILTKKEKPLDFKDIKPQDGSDGFTMTPNELSSMNGKDGGLIYISVKGHIYDVSSAADMYGPDKNYRNLVAKDASLAFAAGCCEDDCIDKYTKEIWYSEQPLNVTAEQEEEIDSWVELYTNHDVYTYVGELVPDPLDSIELDEEIAASNDG